MAEASVVHLKIKGGIVVQDCDVYIGRPMYQGGWRLPGSRWANPYRIGKDGDRARVLAQYEAHVRASPELMAALPELRGKRLGCWCVERHCLVCRRPRGTCAHLNCHGEVLVKLLNEVPGAADPAPAEPPPGPVESSRPTRADFSALDALIPDDDPFWAELGY
jgi:hypothetical protein